MSRTHVTLAQARSLFTRREARLFDILELLASRGRQGASAGQVKTALGYGPNSDHARVILERIADCGVVKRSNGRPRVYRLRGRGLLIDFCRRNVS